MSCVSYFNSTTQNDIPIRILNNYNYTANLGGAGNLDVQVPQVNPCNTWFCESDGTTEYGCLGVKYELNPGGTGYVSSLMNLKEWRDTWKSNNCVGLFNNMLLGGGQNQTTAAFSVNNFFYLQDDFQFMFSRYFNQDISTAYQGPTGPCSEPINTPTTMQTGGKISNADNNCNVYINGFVGQTGANQSYTLAVPGQAGYNPFLDELLQACKDLPGVCQPIQEYMCGECSRNEIASNPALIAMCGCVAPPPGKDAFYNQTMQNYSPACDPLCNRLDTIKTANYTTGSANVCNANVCVIESVTINSIASTGVAPTFNQVCPACADGQGNCICIIDATFENTIPAVQGNSGETIDNPITFNQYCPNSQCYVSDPTTGTFNQVDCLGTLPKGVDAKVSIPTWIYVALILVIVFALLVILAYKYEGDHLTIYQEYTDTYDSRLTVDSYLRRKNL